MNVRDVSPADFGDIDRLHQSSGNDFRLPDLSSPLCIVRKVVTDDSGKIIAAGFLRISAEGIFTMDPSLPVREKMAVMQALHSPVLTDAYNLGLDEVTSSVHIDVEKRFSKRLKQFGWTPDRDGFRSWNRKLV